jgi:enoyl-[acyl-carrier protein] reductase I
MIRIVVRNSFSFSSDWVAVCGLFWGRRPVKAALEAACRYLAYELGPQGIRVHAISPGPLKTRAASALKDFELLLNEAAHKAPLGELVDIMDVGYACVYLATPFAKRVTGGVVYVDGGANLIA